MHRAFIGLSLSAALAMTLFGCRGDPATPAYWDKALGDARRVKERVRVVEDLRESKRATTAFLPLLHGQLASQKSPEVKAALARLIGELKDPSSLQPLTDALELGATDSAANALNKEIAAALASLGNPAAAPPLLKLLRMKDHYTRIEAINALGKLRVKEAVQPLIELATDEQGEPFISKKAIQALGEIGDPSAVGPLVKMMFKERRNVSFYVESSYALFQIGKSAADALVPLVSLEDKKTLAWARENNIIEAALTAKAAQVLGDLQERRAEKALIKQLAFDSEYVDMKLMVRMRMADALGRMRSTESVKALASLLGEEEPAARQEYARALIRIGGREALPALLKSSAQGVWDARESAMIAVAMLGDGRELEAYEKLINQEEARTQAECSEDPEQSGCSEQATLVKSRVAQLERYKLRLVAADTCKQQLECWVRKLDDADAGVRERAALEIGRGGQGALVSELTKRLGERDLNARLALIHAADWLVHDSSEAATKAREALPGLQKQLAEERGKTEFVKVNEDLRRLVVALSRESAT